MTRLPGDPNLPPNVTIKDIDPPMKVSEFTITLSAEVRMAHAAADRQNIADELEAMVKLVDGVDPASVEVG